MTVARSSARAIALRRRISSSATAVPDATSAATAPSSITRTSVRPGRSSRTCATTAACFAVSTRASRTPASASDPADLLRRRGLVDGHAERAGRPAGEVEQGPLVAGAGHDRDAVAGLDAARDEALGHGGDLGGELRDGHRGPGAVDQPLGERPRPGPAAAARRAARGCSRQGPARPGSPTGTRACQAFGAGGHQHGVARHARLAVAVDQRRACRSTRPAERMSSERRLDARPHRGGHGERRPR